MANVSLMHYLQRSPPVLPVQYHGDSFQNTTNDRYSFEDIAHMGHWGDFNLQRIQQRYNALLNAPGLLAPDPFPTSPPAAITSEPVLRIRITQYLQDRIRRSLRAGFHRLHATHTLGQRTPLTWDHGDMAAKIENFRPDTAYFDERILNHTIRPNRAPGDVKPSWKWGTHLRNDPLPGRRKEFKQALSQVNWYMKQHHTRYGYILTDRELVAIRRLDREGRIELSAPIPWNAQGTAAAPQMTVLLGLWYLGMLAAEDQGPLTWRLN